MSGHIRGELERVIDTLSNEELGKRFRWFIKEANHGSWDGWSGNKRELRGMLTLLRDILYWLSYYKS